MTENNDMVRECVRKRGTATSRDIARDLNTSRSHASQLLHRAAFAGCIYHVGYKTIDTAHLKLYGINPNHRVKKNRTKDLSGWKGLCVSIIQRAYFDYTRGSEEHKKDAAQYFRSEWYQMHLDYVGMPRNSYPQGVDVACDVK